MLYKIQKQQNHKISIKAFCFRFVQSESAIVVENVHKLVEYMCQHNVPHNVFMTLEVADVASSSEGQPKTPYLRLFIWLRENLHANKAVAPFNIAFCELSGYVPVGCKFGSVHVTFLFFFLYLEIFDSIIVFVLAETLYETLTEDEMLCKINEELGTVADRLEETFAAMTRKIY